MIKKNSLILNLGTQFYPFLLFSERMRKYIGCFFQATRGRILKSDKCLKSSGSSGFRGKRGKEKEKGRKYRENVSYHECKEYAVTYVPFLIFLFINLLWIEVSLYHRK